MWQPIHFRPKNASRQLQIAVLGTPVRDTYVQANAIAFPDQCVAFQVGPTHFTVPYQGEPIRFGEKRYAQANLGSLALTECAVCNGGGVYHTTAQLAKLCDQRHLSAAISTIDSVISWPELGSAYSQMAINHISLAVEQGTTNLILTNGQSTVGQPERLILKSPEAPMPLSPRQLDPLLALLPNRLDMLVVNSPKSIDLARSVIGVATQRGQAQYSVLTPALSLTDRIELLLTRDCASVCNLSEFALITKALGIDCPSNEESARLEEIAQAMAELARVCKTGDLVVTLGARGCLAGDRSTGVLVHVGLQLDHWQQVQSLGLMHPERKNGIGDRFFGSFVLSHHLVSAQHGNRTVQAASRASLDMVRHLAPNLAPKLNWLAFHSFPQRFSAKAPHHAGRPQWMDRLLHPQWGGYALQYS